MNGLTRKLHSQSGASILLALVFFLLCAFVGAVVMGSAAANAQKISGQRAEQQAYYAVSSAACLIRDTLEDMECQGVEEKTIYQCAGPENQGKTWRPSLHRDQYATPALTVSLGEGGLPELLRQGADAVYQSQRTYLAPGTTAPAFRGWKETFTVEAEGMDAVHVAVSIDRNYQLVFLLESGDSYAMTLTCRAEARRQESQTGGGCAHETPEERVTEDGDTEWVWVSRTFSYTDYTLTTTVKWPRGIITKGVAAHG